ncbi:histone methyltransferase set1, partial [Coemansia furcata]
MTPLVTRDRLRMHFEAYGAVKNIQLDLDPSTGVSLGIARVEFVSAPGAPNSRVAATEAIQRGHVVQPGDPPATLSSDVGNYFAELSKVVKRNLEGKRASAASEYERDRRINAVRKPSLLLSRADNKREADLPCRDAPERSAIRVPRSGISFSNTSEADVLHHFRRFRPTGVIRDGGYWYVLFSSARDARRCQCLSDKQPFAGRAIDVELYEPADKGRLAELDRLARGRHRGLRLEPEFLPLVDADATGADVDNSIPTYSPRAQKARVFDVTDPVLYELARELLLREVSSSFIQDLQRRRLQALVSSFAQSPHSQSTTDINNRAEPLAPNRQIAADTDAVLKKMAQSRIGLSDSTATIGSTLADLPSFRRGGDNTQSSKKAGNGLAQRQRKSAADGSEEIIDALSSGKSLDTKKVVAKRRTL